MWILIGFWQGVMTAEVPVPPIEMLSVYETRQGCERASQMFLGGMRQREQAKSHRPVVVCYYAPTHPEFEPETRRLRKNS
jgi:hypothetical protein